MKIKTLFFIIILFSKLAIAQIAKEVKGVVTFASEGLSNVKVGVIDSDNEVYTNAEGRYSIKVQEGETVYFKYQGMKTLEIVIEDVTSILNVRMTEQVVALDEVVVRKKKGNSQEDLKIEFGTNKNVIRTLSGYKNAASFGFGIKIIDGDDLNPGAIDFISAIQGRFSGRIVGAGLNRNIILRGNFSLQRQSSVIYDVDGLILMDPPLYLPVQDIDRIAVMPGIGAAGIYGPNATGGVIIINTKSANTLYEEKGEELYDYAKMRNNLYQNDAISVTHKNKGYSRYLTALRGTIDMKSAKLIYNKFDELYSNNLDFILDTYSFFMERGDSDFAESLIEDKDFVFTGNPLASKALAYHLEVFGKFEKANECYKAICALRPKYAQSYRDVANSYRKLGKIKEAAGMYLRYYYLVDQELLRNDSTAFNTIIDTEFGNLIHLEGEHLINGKSSREVKKDANFKGTRLTFEWNDSEAEFILQFVSPENQYFNSEHSLVADSDRIMNEKRTGFSMEQYLIDDSLKGTWQVNVKYLGNKSLSPSYIKATIYHNYGSPNQRSETKLFKMRLRDTNQEWFKVSNTTGVVLN